MKLHLLHIQELIFERIVLCQKLHVNLLLTGFTNKNVSEINCQIRLSVGHRKQLWLG